ncbi:MAG: hypothetical protein RLZZ303_2522 [Candidatus Hydrogenedentota bacterium]|jgi:parvulin-like peptidyl-prolyl isomerase
MTRSIQFALALMLAAAAHAQAPDLSKLDLVERSVPNGPVAMVDGVPISNVDYLNLYRGQLMQLAALAGPERITEENRVQAGIECLRQIVRERILLNEAAKRGITVSQSEAEAEYAKMLADTQAEIQENTGKPVSEAEFLEKLGRTREQVVAKTREDMVLERVRAALLQGVNTNVPDADVQKFYENNKDKFARPGGVHLRQVFIRPEGGANAGPAAWEAAQKAAEKALARVRAGETIEKVAADVSDAPDKDRGGNVIVPAFENLPPFYQSAIGKMKPGELSGVIKSEHGYHFFLYVASKESESGDLDDVEDRIRNILTRVKEEEALNNFIRPIETAPDRVQIYLELEKNMPESMLNKAGQPAS